MGALRALDTCSVSDALDTLHLAGAVTGIHPMWEPGHVVAGVVRTVAVAPKSTDGAAAHVATALVATAEPDDVIVIDNHGRIDVSSWGGLLAEAAVHRGVVGVIVDGACRDIGECEDLGLPLYSRAAVPVSARGRLVQKAMDVQIQVGHVSVMSGDLVIADRNGIAFIPYSQVDAVLDLARRITERETAMSAAVRSGRSVLDVMHDSQFPSIEVSKN
ncbi:4-carboxy-4-hydroxy-2-oxoadipate aldolase/oxaloacetate decarboxylase [Arthrobacter sp. CDRTa11]|nr:4-carboxy-4-hydroxy-2-oxoadipate aldolase/oxaloacetate decarboxylase [Arthrobacter sp. CDRTa11]